MTDISADPALTGTALTLDDGSTLTLRFTDDIRWTEAAAFARTDTEPVNRALRA